MLKEIDHVAIAVDDFDKMVDFYTNKLQMKLIKVEVVEKQGIKAAFFEIGSVKIELIAPIDENSTVAKFLAKKGPGFHHIAYKVENIESSIAQLKEQGLQMINETPQVGANNKKIAFIHPNSTAGVLTEICQQSLEQDQVLDSSLVKG